ncbi:MAG TPA: prephenate dehydrogenase/arogenate dehydrogenase family protein [Actinomycetota bacterium]
MTSPDGAAGRAGVGVVGTGLIGTSVALAAGAAGIAVRGWDADRSVLDRASAMSPLEPAGSLDDAAAAEVVFVCTTLAVVPEAAIAALNADGRSVVSDVGSVKGSVVGEVARASNAAARFVGGHPMAGSERSGPEAAAATLLDGATWVLTPTEGTDPIALDRVRSIVEAFGGRPVVMTPDEHDRAVALVSHLPQVVSSALMAFAGREHGQPDVLGLAAGGFRDLTRLAGSSPELWEGILVENAPAVSDELSRFASLLMEVRDAVSSRDGAALVSLLEEARRGRALLATKPNVRSGVVVLQVPIPDRPGALARLTSAMADHEVNIEDLQIVHAADGGRGNAHVTVGTDQGDEALVVLGEAGFAPVRLT